MGGYLFQQNYGFQVGDYLKKSIENCKCKLDTCTVEIS